MSEPTLRFYTVPLGKADGVLGVAVMDRPKASNALDHGMIRELEDYRSCRDRSRRQGALD